MKFTHVCIINRNISSLRDLPGILQVQPEQSRDDYVEFRTGGAILALFSLEGHESIAPKSVILGPIAA